MTDAVAGPEVGRRPASALSYALATLTAVLLLYLMSVLLTTVRCEWLLPLVIFIAWPLWRLQTDRVLFERRAILASVATPSGSLWRWFSRGRITSVIQVFVSLALSLVLLTLSSSLTPTHWAILAADGLLLALLVRPARRLLASQIKDAYLGLVARRWPLAAINVVLVVAAFVALEFFFIGRPDTRGLEWTAVVGRAFEVGQQGVVCPAAGLVLGAVRAVDQLSWHLAIGLLPSLPSTSARVLAWSGYLAWTGFGGLLFTRYLLGTFALVDGFTRAEAGSEDRFSRAFVYTLLVLAIPYLYATIKLAEWTPEQLTLPSAPTVVADDPCRVFLYEVQQLTSVASSDVNLARTEAVSAADQRIDAALDQAFGAAEQGVEGYLDWYYSLIGDYTRLAAVVTGDVGQLMTDQLEKHVFEDTNVFELLETASTDVERESMERMENAAAAVGARIGEFVSQNKCPFPGFDPGRLVHLDRDRLRAVVATTAGGAVAAKFLLAKPAAAAAGKLAAKGSIKVAGKVMAKAAAKKGASAVAAAGAATAICSPAGPAALLCGAGAGLVTWFTVDKVILEIDEAVNRDDMRAELLAGLAEQRAAAADSLKTMHRSLVDIYATEINKRVGEVFIPARDGT